MLGGLLKEVAGALFDSLIGAMQRWWRQHQLKKAEAKAATAEARLEGFQEAETVEEKIEKAQKNLSPSLTWEEFKKSRALLWVLSATLFLGGCCIQRGANVSKMPIIQVEGEDPREQLDTSEPPSENELLLIQYIERLETAIDAYNEEAKRLNEERLQ